MTSITQRGNRRQTTFFRKDDYRAYLDLLVKWCAKYEVRIWAFCLMPNHVHLIGVPPTKESLCPAIGEAHRQYTRRISRAQREQGVVAAGNSLLTVLRYVERNTLRAGLVRRAEDWRWGSLWRRTAGDAEQQRLLTDPPNGWPTGWADLVNQPRTRKEHEAIARCVARGRPFGSDQWVRRMAGPLGLESTLRPRGRPKKTKTMA